jgi:hypothetical protein
MTYLSRSDLDDAIAHAERALGRLRASLPDMPDGRRMVAALSDAVADPETYEAARKNLRNAVKERPLTALAVAFGAGLALALATKS